MPEDLFADDFCEVLVDAACNLSDLDDVALVRGVGILFDEDEDSNWLVFAPIFWFVSSTNAAWIIAKERY